MATRDDRDDESMEEDILRHTRQVYKHLLTASLVLFLLFGAFGGGLFALVNAIDRADELLAVKPENRADKLGKKIANTRESVEKQYADLEARMQDETITNVRKRYQIIYDMSQQDERDYAQLLSSYQQASYQIAGRIRGSGEWYHYYERDLKELIARQRAAEARLATFVSDN